MSFWDKISVEGLKLPYAHDPATGQASVTLLFPYIVFILALIANAILLYKDTFTGTVTAIIFWAVAMIFYLIRRLSKAKIDLDDKSIELDGEADKNSN